MTLIIIDDCTHNKTFSVYDKPNGTIKILEAHGFHLNPRVHADPVSEGVADGSQAETTSSASDRTSTPPILKESKSGEPSDIFGEAD